MKSPFKEIIEELWLVHNGIMRDLVNTNDPSLERFMHKERLEVVYHAMNIVRKHSALKPTKKPIQPK
jgi:hypothetical protein